MSGTPRCRTNLQSKSSPNKECPGARHRSGQDSPSPFAPDARMPAVPTAFCAHNDKGKQAKAAAALQEPTICFSGRSTEGMNLAVLWASWPSLGLALDGKTERGQGPRHLDAIPGAEASIAELDILALVSSSKVPSTCLNLPRMVPFTGCTECRVDLHKCSGWLRVVELQGFLAQLAVTCMRRAFHRRFFMPHMSINSCSSTGRTKANW